MIESELTVRVTEPIETGPRWLKPVLQAVVVLALVVAIGLVWRFMAQDSAFDKDLARRAESSAKKGATAIEAVLSGIESETKVLADTLDQDGARRADGAIGKLLETIPAVTAAGYVPPGAGEGGDPEKRPATISVRRPNGQIETMKGTSQRAAGEGWLEPYYRLEVKERVAEYSLPLKNGGVVFADFGATAIDKVVDSIDLGSSGFAFVVSAKKGRVLSYPVSEYVSQKQSLEELSTRIEEPAYAKLADSIKASEAGRLKAVSGRTGSGYWLAHQKVKQTGWAYAVRLSTDKSSAAMVQAKKDLIQIAVVLLVLVTAGLALYFGVGGFETYELWRLSVIWGVGLIAGTIFIWFQALHTPKPVDSDAGIRLTDRGQLQRYISKDPYANGKLTFQEPIRIKTGIHVQSIDFHGSNGVTLTGIVWQQIPDALKGKFEPGVYFPEAVDPNLAKAYERPAVNGTTIGWNFATEIKQEFGYGQYPLDHQNASLRMRPVEFDKNIMLIPDLDSYGTWDLGDFPGIDLSTLVEGWHFEQTFFDYTKLRYKSNFGIETYVGQSDFPELRFNILVGRDFSGPMTGVVLPMAIISVLLFLNLFFAKEGEKALGVLGPIAAFFFSVAVTHAKIRDQLATGDFMFMEIFCLELYLLIGFVAISAIFKAHGVGPQIFRTRDGLWPKLLYWPLLSTLLFVSSVIVYYN
jgi:hypothetical protein